MRCTFNEFEKSNIKRNAFLLKFQEMSKTDWKTISSSEFCSYLEGDVCESLTQGQIDQFVDAKKNFLDGIFIHSC